MNYHNGTCYGLDHTTYMRRINDVANRMLRIGLRPAWLEPRVDKQARSSWLHNEQRQKAAAARRARMAHHDQTTLQAKAWKAKYDQSRRLHREAQSDPTSIPIPAN